MKLALAQINPTVGDLAGNTRKIIDFINQAKKAKADLVVFPELAITGYPPEDLLLKSQFVTDNLVALKKIVKTSRGVAVYLGFVDRIGPDLFNAGAFIAAGKIKKVYHKNNLPNYSVFDEKRYFKEGRQLGVVNYRGLKFGLSICEDIWVQKTFPAGLDFILSINASPFHIGKIWERQKMLVARARKAKAALIYLNLVGGQDELVFDGGSMVISPKGKLLAAASQYQEEILIADLPKEKKITPRLEELAEIYGALILGVRDYVHKNNFREVVIGLSGGIDSALTAVIATDALGSSKVHAVFMPSKYSSQQSLRDAAELAKNLKIDFKIFSISEMFAQFLADLAPHFKDRPADITEENLQARLRGNILMAFSNKFGWLVLTTGNKSETSTGYCTLYGDMAGGFNLLKDVPKILVYKLSKWCARIPESIIQRPPTAELKPDQKDQDTLPPYEILDQIIRAYVEKNMSFKQIAALGFKTDVVKKVIKLIDGCEYKRRQAAPGPRISPRAFGKDWRLPITNLYHN